MCDEKCVSYCQCDKSPQKLELLIATKNTNIFLNTLLYSDFVFHEICYIQFYKKNTVSVHYLDFLSPEKMKLPQFLSRQYLWSSKFIYYVDLTFSLFL